MYILVEDNVRANYDLSLGSLYDYDNSKYLYDETILMNIQSIQGFNYLVKKTMNNWNKT